MTENKDLQQIKEDIQNIKDEATYRGYYGSLANKMIDVNYHGLKSVAYNLL